MDLKKDIQYVKGIGVKKAQKLNKLNIFTLKDLLYYFPRQFEDRNNLKKIIDLQHEEKATIKVTILGISVSNPKKGINIIKIDVRDETGYAKLVFFNQNYIKNTFKVGDSILVFGKVKKEFKNIEIISCELEHLSNSPKNVCKILPIYSLTYGVSNKDISSIIRHALSDKNIIIKEYMPKYIIDKYKLCSIDYAIRNIHNPISKEALKVALYRIVFEEFLILQLGLLMFKNGIKETKGIKFCESKKLTYVKDSLGFELTNAQSKVLSEIIKDMQSEDVMNRLVQGDVGSGKTVVAMIALYNCVLNGYQGALMAPTEILAEQHYIYLCDILKSFGVNIELLVGSLSKKQKEDIILKVKNKEVDILIGTHALIEDKVEFNKLGLVITDEQHRFGVKQRTKLSEKGENPDILVMTATPIPRTLALILYGDLDISIIDELPPGRQAIQTMAIDKNKRNRAYNSLVRKEVEKGRQVYIVCPLVEESESIEAKSATELVEELKNEYFKDLKLGLLHGKMKSSEKDFIMKSFKNKEIDVLVSTTVIEVGVNVPNATLMIIENAERFGLAQLHQLRGRVGRGKYKSYCILIYSSKSEVCRQRMSIMEETSDGFKISEKDLEIRGPGEFFGTRQHGLPELKVANIFKHMKILELAQEGAKFIFSLDSKLENCENKMLKKEIMEKFEHSIKEISLN